MIGQYFPVVNTQPQLSGYVEGLFTLQNSFCNGLSKKELFLAIILWCGMCPVVFISMICM